LDSQGNVIYCDDAAATIVTIGVENMVIVKRGDTVLVTRKDRTQDIKELLQRPELAKQG
jgi:mannose-1-phosphate guanylyltransferase